MRTFKAALASAALVFGTLVALTAVQPAQAAGGLTTIDPTLVGTTPDLAAGSCWEIKQLNPSSTDGVYWLLTPAMSEPQQFYCDQTTNGGGWVLIGKGRNGWNKNLQAVGSPSDLLSPDLNPMSSATTQYDSTTVDGLLNNGRVDALPDGLRIRRATNTAGTSWQEVRMKFSKFGHWAWALGALNPLSSWSLGTTNGTGGTSQNFGSGTGLTRLTNIPGTGNQFSLGFAYGSSITGSNASTSYLWSPTNGGGAIPYAQVYIRPQVRSSDAGFTAIPDSGTAAYAQPAMASSFALPSSWGVSGLAGSTSIEGSVEVQAFTQSGNNMYVGGNFKYVQQDAAGTGQVQQSFLAAFNINTGDWVSSFRPVLNEQVKALATLPNGDVVAGGRFSQANGQPATAIVALNPTTGATDPNWKVGIANMKTGGVTQVNGLSTFGGFLYIAGSFTHLSGGSINYNVYNLNMGRVSVANGTPSTDWNPEINGTVNDIAGGNVSGQSDRMYAAGYFTQSHTTPTQSAAAFQATSGAALATPAWNPVWSSSNNYQRAIDTAPGEIWVGGSEHDMFQFDPVTFNRTYGDIMNDKGDIQAITVLNGNVYAGCHCNYYDYQNSYTWPSIQPTFTRTDAMNWVGGWNATTGQRLPQFAPLIDSRGGAGVWALGSDTNGVLWAGGDIDAVPTATKRGAWAGGFARFGPNDSTAPPTPGNFRVMSQDATTVTLAWNPVTDASGVHYEILRDDRPIAATDSTSITVPLSPSGRFFVRAEDGAGNLSASTSVLAVGNGQIPPNAAFTSTTDHNTVSFDGSTSTSSSGTITDYLWDFGDGTGAHGQTIQHTYATAGNYNVSLTVTTSTGATDTVLQSVTAGTPPANQAPSDIYGNQVYTDGPYLYYRLGEATATTVAKDSGPDGRNGTYNSTASMTFGQAGALKNSTDTAVRFNGSGGFISSAKVAAAPNTFSEAIWFKTTSTTGGRLIGYSSSPTGLSNNYDRHIYMENSGQLVFGAYNAGEVKVESPGSYNDGQWHMAVATMSPTDGMRLYVDGAQVGTNANGTAENFVGYWRVGGDHVWENTTSNNLNGTLDEAAVFAKVLTPAQISTEYTDGSTVITPPANNPPTAAFTVGNTNLTAQVDASGSSDSDGTIASYSWNFGDGSNLGSGQVTSHAYSQSGTYTITLTVTDNGGATNSVQHNVTVNSPPVSSVVVADGATWSWKYDATAPPAAWNTVGFDASAWNTGAAVLGFGDPSVQTNIDTFATTSQRPAAAYFVHTFQVDDKTKVTQLVLNTVADDGIVVYVNGTEVNRTNMSPGTVTNTTFANAAVRTAKAPAVVVNVPTNLLVNGTNVVAAETHLNYRGTPDISFHLKATLTTQN